MKVEFNFKRYGEDEACVKEYLQVGTSCLIGYDLKDNGSSHPSKMSTEIILAYIDVTFDKCHCRETNSV